VSDFSISSSAIIDYFYETIVGHLNINTISVIASLKGNQKPSQLFLHYAKKCLQVSLNKKSLTSDEINEFLAPLGWILQSLSE
jgi:hypothetical protein